MIEAIKTALKEQNRSQLWLARETGINPPHVSLYLTGKRPLGQKNRQKMLDALGLTLELTVKPKDSER